MDAFSAAKRAALAAVCFAFILAAPVALAADDNSGYLGVMLQEISPSMAKALQLGEKSGVMINEVVKDSPAATAGLEDGDIILMFQGEAVADPKDLTTTVRKTKPGAQVDLVILHNGKKETRQVELGEREDNFTWTEAGDGNVFMFKGDGDEDIHLEMLKGLHEDMDGEHQIIIKKMTDGGHGDVAFFNADRGFLGVHLDDISGQMGDYFEVKDGKSVLITEVTEDSPAAKAGLKAGDIIVKLDDEDIASTDQLHQKMAETKPEQEVQVKVTRKGKGKTMKVTLGEAPDDMIKKIQVITEGDDRFHVRAPKMLFHGKGGDLRTLPHGEREWVYEKEDLDQLRQDLKEMKKELKEIKKELKK